MFEHHTEPFLSRLQFTWRISRSLLVTVLLAAFSMLVGTLGYHFLVGIDWDDSFHLACLVLGDHDVEIRPESTAGKIFAGVYVMYARLVFFSVAVILAAPILHRILHKLHLDTPTDGSHSGDQDTGAG
jgi:hypothetical protein